MTYSVDHWVFEKNPNICFGIIIGKKLKNTQTTKEDDLELTKAEEIVRQKLNKNDIKLYPPLAVYRKALENVEINPNKYINSVEAMIKRIINGHSLPRINALVDLCNAIALKNFISLGAHDLRDVNDNLEVRLSKNGDKFLPINGKEFEKLPPNELVFVSSNIVQTREWLWRQSELGKTRIDSENLIFQLVGFNDNDSYNRFLTALKETEELIKTRFNGTAEVFIVDSKNKKITFN